MLRILLLSLSVISVLAGGHDSHGSHRVTDLPGLDEQQAPPSLLSHQNPQ